jgi:hypothetical protein
MVKFAAYLNRTLIMASRWSYPPPVPTRSNLRTAATIAGFAVNPFTAASFPEANTAIAHLRDVLGDQTYESLARKGEAMTTAETVTYAYDKSTRPEQN